MIRFPPGSDSGINASAVTAKWLSEAPEVRNWIDHGSMDIDRGRRANDRSGKPQAGAQELDNTNRERSHKCIAGGKANSWSKLAGRAFDRDLEDSARDELDMNGNRWRVPASSPRS